MYDLSSSNPNPVINYEGVSKNVTGVGFQEEGKWMFTGGEDCSARIWDLRLDSCDIERNGLKIKHSRVNYILECVKGEVLIKEDFGK